jgi:uncharacterized lipoprotein YajG
MHYIDKTARNTAIKRGDNQVFHLREKRSISVLKESVVRKILISRGGVAF